MPIQFHYSCEMPINWWQQQQYFLSAMVAKRTIPVDRIDQTMHTNLINKPLRNVAAASIFVHDIHHEDGNRSTSRYRRRKYSLYDHTLSNWQSTYRTERWQIMMIQVTEGNENGRNPSVNRGTQKKMISKANTWYITKRLREELKREKRRNTTAI